MKVGLARMVLLAGKPKGKPKSEPASEDAEGGAIKAFIAASRDGDDEGAAKAFRLAVRACVDSYENAENADTDEADEDE